MKVFMQVVVTLLMTCQLEQSTVILLQVSNMLGKYAQVFSVYELVQRML